MTPATLPLPLEWTPHLIAALAFALGLVPAAAMIAAWVIL